MRSLKLNDQVCIHCLRSIISGLSHVTCPIASLLPVYRAVGLGLHVEVKGYMEKKTPHVSDIGNKIRYISFSTLNDLKGWRVKTFFSNPPSCSRRLPVIGIQVHCCTRCDLVSTVVVRDLSLKDWAVFQVEVLKTRTWNILGVSYLVII